VRIRSRFAYAWRFPEGEDRAAVDTCAGGAIVGPSGVIVAGPKPEWGGGRVSFHEGLAVVPGVGGGDDEFTVLDRDGKSVVNQHGTAGYYAGGLLGVWFGERDKPTVEFLDRSGRVVVPAITGTCWPCVFGADGLVTIKAAASGHAGALDTSGKWVISPKFDSLSAFHDGLALITIGGKGGVIDRTGAFIVAPRFDDMRPFAEGVAWVRLNDRSGFIDAHGVFVLPPRFGGPTQGEEFSEGVAAVRDASTNTVGFIDHQGATQVPFLFVDAGHFHGGVAPAVESEGSLTKASECGYIDRKGQWITSARWNKCPDFEDGVAAPSRWTGGMLPPTPPDIIEYINASGHKIGELLRPPPCSLSDGGT
jgi:hypothetical protein